MTDSYDFMTDVDVVQKPAAKKRGRIWELDFIRGFLTVSYTHLTLPTIA